MQLERRVGRGVLGSSRLPLEKIERVHAEKEGRVLVGPFVPLLELSIIILRVSRRLNVFGRTSGLDYLLPLKTVITISNFDAII